MNLGIPRAALNRHAAQLIRVAPEAARARGNRCRARGRTPFLAATLCAVLGTGLPVASCAHGIFASNARTAAQNQLLSDSIGADAKIACRVVAGPWEVPAPVRQASLVWDGEDAVLVYEGQFREAVKTVWQPLEPGSLAFQGDGLVLGNRGTPFVRDFRKQLDAAGNTWTSFRQKAPSGETYTAVVEYLEGQGRGTLIRFALPTARTESVQEIWLLPLSQAGRANVVVRVNSTSLNNEDGIDRSRFSWFSVAAGSGTQARKLGDYTEAFNTFSSVEFVQTEKEGEPVAIGIASPSSRGPATQSQKAPRMNFKLLALRMFRRGANEETILYESQAPLGSLVAKPRLPQDKVLHLAWFEEAADSSYPKLQWVQAPFDPALPKGLAAAFAPPPQAGPPVPPPPPAKTKAKAKGKAKTKPPAPAARTLLQALVRTRALSHIASHLEFLPHPLAPDAPPILTWWANLENDFALNALQTSSGRALGIFAGAPDGRIVGTGQARRDPREQFMIVLRRAPEGEGRKPLSRLELCQFKAEF